MADKSIGTESFATEKKKTVKKRLRLAFIGCGGICQTHIAAIAKIPELEIVAGCDIDPERLEVMKTKHGIQKVYEKWDDMLKAVKPDVVDVCTPNGVHAPATIAALNAGCHVIVEKPMAMNPAECVAMIEAAKKNKKLLCAGFQQRYNPKSQFLKQLREAGDIGDIMFVKCQALRRRGVPNWGVFGQKDLQGGGPLIDIGVHIIECAHYCMGEPKPVAATGNVWTYMGNKPSNVWSQWPNWDWKTLTVEDLAIGHIRFDNGAIMQIESSFCAHIPESVMNFTVMGTKGGYNWSEGEFYTDHAGAMINAKGAYFPPADFTELFVKKLQNFADAVLNGTPLESPGEEGLAVQKILDGIYRSAAKGGKEVKID